MSIRIPIEKRLRYYEWECKNTTEIPTSLKGESDLSIIASIRGQCSDGIWENSKEKESYWRFCKVLLNPLTNKVEIRIEKQKTADSFFGGKLIENPYIDKTNQEIRNWFANKLKEIVAIEAKDKKILWDFNETNISKVRYLGNWQQTVADCYQVYKKLYKQIKK